MKITDIFFNIKTDLSAIGLIRAESFPHYFCTPINAVIFASLGVDGIHFCILPEENDLTLEHSPVYVVSPMLDQPHWVMIAAEDFRTFLSFVVSTRDAGALECISYLHAEKYAEYLNTISYDLLDANEAVEVLTSTFQLKEVTGVYDYVKELQKNMNLSRIKFSKEYYEIIG